MIRAKAAVPVAPELIRRWGHLSFLKSAGVWRESLDDRLTTYETGVDFDGYVWGVNWQLLCPGTTLVIDSPTARNWAAAVGIDFHEVRIQASTHDLTLIFSDLQIEELPPDWQGPDHKFPIQ